MRTSVPNKSGRWLLVVGALAIVLVYALLLIDRFDDPPLGTLAPVVNDEAPDLTAAVIPLAVSAAPNPVTAGDTLTVTATCNEDAAALDQRRAEIIFADADAVPVPASGWNDDVVRHDIVIPADTEPGQYQLIVRCLDRVAAPPGEPTSAVDVEAQVTTTTAPPTTTTEPTPTTTEPDPSAPATTLVQVD